MVLKRSYVCIDYCILIIDVLYKVCGFPVIEADLSGHLFIHHIRWWRRRNSLEMPKLHKAKKIVSDV